MPIYEYVCQQCGKLTDVLQKVNDPPPRKCEGCGAEGALNRVVSRTSFVLKGGGWYSDLYGSAKKEAKKEGGEGSPAAAGAASGGGAGGASSGSGGTSSAASSPPPAPAASASDKK